MFKLLQESKPKYTFHIYSLITVEMLIQRVTHCVFSFTYIFSLSLLLAFSQCDIVWGLRYVYLLVHVRYSFVHNNAPSIEVVPTQYITFYAFVDLLTQCVSLLSVYLLFSSVSVWFRIRTLYAMGTIYLKIIVEPYIVRCENSWKKKTFPFCRKWMKIQSYASDCVAL